MSGSRNSLKRASLVFNPRAENNWSKDNSKFGQRMLEKMGWKKGQGIGPSGQGITENIKIRFKVDSKGLGFKIKDDKWVEVEHGFAELLSHLSQESNTEKCKRSSLESTSQSLRSRVHYHKFTRGKDISKYNKNDLSGILGKTVIDHVENEDSVDLNSEKNNHLSDEMDNTIKEEYYCTPVKKKKKNDTNFRDEIILTENDDSEIVSSVKDNENFLPNDDFSEHAQNRQTKKEMKKKKSQKPITIDIIEIMDDDFPNVSELKDSIKYLPNDEGEYGKDNNIVKEKKKNKIKKTQNEIIDIEGINLDNGKEIYPVGDCFIEYMDDNLPNVSKLEDYTEHFPNNEGEYENVKNTVKVKKKKKMRKTQNEIIVINDTNLDNGKEIYPMGDCVIECIDDNSPNVSKLEEYTEHLSNDEGEYKKDKNTSREKKKKKIKKKKNEIISIEDVSLDNGKEVLLVDDCIIKCKDNVNDMEGSYESSKKQKKDNKFVSISEIIHDDDDVENMVKCEQHDKINESFEDCYRKKNKLKHEHIDGSKKKKKKSKKSDIENKNLDLILASDGCHTSSIKKKSKNNRTSTAAIDSFMESVKEYNKTNNVEDVIKLFEESKEKLLNKYRENYRMKYLSTVNENDSRIYCELDGNELDCKKNDVQDENDYQNVNYFDRQLTKAERIIQKARLLKKIQNKGINHDFKGSNLSNIKGYGNNESSSVS